MLSSKINNNEEDKGVVEMQKLLSNPDDAKVADLMRTMSPNSKWVARENEVGVRIEKSKLKHIGDSFTKNEIVNDAIKYNLSFIRATQYEGDYSIDFARNLEKFISEKGLAVSPDDARVKLFVLFPNKLSWKRKRGLYEGGDCKNPLVFFNVGGYYILIDGKKDFITIQNWYLGLRENSSANFISIVIAEHILLANIMVFVLNYFFNCYAASIAIALILNFIAIIARTNVFLAGIPDFFNYRKYSRE